MNCYESNTLNQPATPFTYENSSTRHGSTSARAWEDGIDEVLLQTNSSIEKLMEMRQPVQDLNSKSNKYSLSGRARARSTSVPRLSAPAPNKEVDMSSITAFEQKLDFMYRRIKMLDDKVKSMEKEKLENRNFSVDTMSAIRHVADAQAADQKQIFLLKDNAVTIRSDLEVFNRREKEMLVKIEGKAPKLTDVDQERLLMETVTKVIRIKFKSQIKEAAVMFAADHANRVAKWAEKSIAEIDRMRHESQRLEVQAIPVIETELRGVILELERLKGRHDVIDNSYRSLENTVMSREMKAEEAHKKAVRNYKKEMSAVMDTVGKRMNEQLSLSRSNEGDCGGSNDRWMQRLCVVEAFQKEQSAQLKTGISSMPVQATNTAVTAAEECQAGVTRKSLQNITAQPDLEMHKKQSLELIVEKLQADLRDMKMLHSEYESASSTAIDTLTSSNRKIKGKINELSAGMASFSKIREAVESLLVEVHLRTKGDHGPKGDNCDHTDHGPKGDNINLRDNGPKGDGIVHRDYGPKGNLKNALVDIHDRLGSLERNAVNREKKNNSESQQLILQNDLIAIQSYGSLPSAVQECIENEISRLQADLEDAVNTGWVDVTARNTVVAQDTAKLSEVVKLLQLTLVTMQSEQQGLEKRMTTLECNTVNAFNTANSSKDAMAVQELPTKQVIKRPSSSQPFTRRKRENTSVVVTEKVAKEEIGKQINEKTEEKIEEEMGMQTEAEAETEEEAEEQAFFTGPTEQNEILALEPLYVRIGLHESSVFAQQSTSTSESSGSSFSLTSHLAGSAHPRDREESSGGIQSTVCRSDSTDRISNMARTNAIPKYLHQDQHSSPSVLSPRDDTAVCVDVPVYNTTHMHRLTSPSVRAVDRATATPDSSGMCAPACPEYDVVGARVAAVAGTAGSSSASLSPPLPSPLNQPSTPMAATVISVLSPIPVCIDYDSDIEIENNVEVENKGESISNGSPLERIHSSTFSAEEKLTSKKNEHRSRPSRGVMNSDT